jgi:class 3 adenylate cyclase/tetratricopeptide (TPR) repeat protein
MGCPSCSADNPAAARFCMSCGSALAALCPACGQSNPPVARFCMQCAKPLTSTQSAASAQPASVASPQSYTPRHLAEKILASRSALEGERKQVTVLFADVAASTELIRDLDTEDAQTILDGAVHVMMDAVHRYEGTVSRTMGDGVMALFGAPLAHEDHAVRACYAALALQAGIQRFAEEVFARHALRLQARVGLNSGEVVVRLVSDDLHMDYTAMGQTVHLAARMEQLAAAGSSALTEATLSLVEGYVRVRSLGRPPVKGLAEPIEVFELLGAGMARTRLQAAVARGLTRFVGRQAELDALHGTLERAKAGHGQVAALVGEPGVGKSRLVWEMTHSHRVQGWTILESGSVSYGKATSYLPVIDLLKAYCRIEARDGARAIREKLTGKLLTLDEGLRPALTPLLFLLDVPVEDPAWEGLDPPQRRRLTLDALKRLLLRESREQPFVLVFEDLHWIDGETQALLDGLVESLPTARILLLVNYRPEYTHSWGSKTYYTQLRIDPLAPESAEELLEALLGPDPSVGPLKPLLIERTEGNPFFLEECVRTLVETGALVGEHGAYCLVEEGTGIRVPATVQAVLAARIDRLPPDDKHLLQTAAVIGKDVPYGLLRAIAAEDAGEDALRSCLALLQSAEFLYEASLFPELEYTFKHALTHEVAYGSLLQERRRALHGRIVDAIESLYPDRLDEHLERLAHHALRGERWEAAASYGHRAGAKASARLANREAVAYLDQALAALEQLAPTRRHDELAIDVRLDLRVPLDWLGEQALAASHLEAAEALATRLGDHGRLARVLGGLTACYTIGGDHDRAIGAAERALLEATAASNPAAEVVASYHKATAHWHRGEYDQAVDWAARGLRPIGDELLFERFGMSAYASVNLRYILGMGLTARGQFDEALAHLREAVRIADVGDHPYSQAVANLVLCRALLTRGEFQGAIPALERALRLAETWSIGGVTRIACAHLAVAYAAGGRSSEAGALIERTLHDAAPGRLQRYGMVLVLAAQASLLRGEDDAQVDGLLRRALDWARAHGERGHEAMTLRLAAAQAMSGEASDLAAAQPAFGEALALADELGMRPLQAHCHLGLGKLYRRMGRNEEARAELSTAVDMLRQMEMTFWLPEAEAELAATSAPPSAEQVG